MACGSSTGTLDPIPSEIVAPSSALAFITGTLLGARLRLRPRAAVVALVRAGLPLLGEDSGLLSDHVGSGDDHHQRLLLTLCPPLFLLLLRLLLVSGQRGLHRTGTEHGEICQASILVHQPGDTSGITHPHTRACVFLTHEDFFLYQPWLSAAASILSILVWKER